MIRPPPRVLVVFGTRPEAIKMAPVVIALEQDPRFAVATCLTAQHRGLLDDVVRTFALRVDADLDAMRADQTPGEVAARVLDGMPAVLKRLAPDVVLVQGDTTSAFAAALAAFHAGAAVGHVEAGLRSFDVARPFPEEMNRRLTSGLATLHFAPTATARDNLIAERVALSSITVTGNTVVDAVRWMRAQGVRPSLPDLDEVGRGRRAILVTAHRRESFGAPLRRICEALAALGRRGDVEIVFPVHPNPSVRHTVDEMLAAVPGVRLLPPVDYPTLLFLLDRATLVISDSGGLQEEAPSFGKPMLVLRDVTERPEAVEAGTARLVGADPERIVTEATRLLDDATAYAAMSRAANPFGDGQAAPRIRDAIAAWWASRA